MKKTVLLCTNNLLTYEILSRPLQVADCRVLFAVNVREITERCTPPDLDLFVVDLDWPFDGRGDAHHATKYLLGLRPDLPGIVISGRRDLRTAVRALGVAAVAQKPINVPAVLRTARELLDRAGRARGQGLENHDATFRVTPNPGALRPAFWEQVHSPFEALRQPRYFGLNE